GGRSENPGAVPSSKLCIAVGSASPEACVLQGLPLTQGRYRPRKGSEGYRCEIAVSFMGGRYRSATGPDRRGPGGPRRRQGFSGAAQETLECGREADVYWGILQYE